MLTAVSHMEPLTLLIPCSALDMTLAARTPARETLVAPSCVASSCLVLFLGAMAVLRLATLVFTLRPHTSSAGSTIT